MGPCWSHDPKGSFDWRSSSLYLGYWTVLWSNGPAIQDPLCAKRKCYRNINIFQGFSCDLKANATPKSFPFGYNPAHSIRTFSTGSDSSPWIKWTSSSLTHAHRTPGQFLFGQVSYNPWCESQQSKLIGLLSLPIRITPSPRVYGVLLAQQTRHTQNCACKIFNLLLIRRILPIRSSNCVAVVTALRALIHVVEHLLSRFRDLSWCYLITDFGHETSSVSWIYAEKHIASPSYKWINTLWALKPIIILSRMFIGSQFQVKEIYYLSKCANATKQGEYDLFSLLLLWNQYFDLRDVKEYFFEKGSPRLVEFQSSVKIETVLP